MREELDAVYEKIKPDEKDLAEMKKVAESVSRFLKEKHLEFVLAGSFARGTMLKSNKEMDFFVFHPTEMDKDQLRESVVSLAKEMKERNIIDDYVISFASHPYVKCKIKDITVEIVPCYKSEEIISAVDRTPKHNEFVKKHLKEEQKKDVVLLKAFLKERNLYGAEDKVKGFSGYLCELLIIHYGSFTKLLEEAAKWRRGVLIKFNDEPLRKFFDHPLVVIDPVDPNRNVAANLSEESFWRFVMEARLYIEGKRDFFLKPEDTGVSEGRFLYALESEIPDVVEEIAWSQLKKLGKELKKFLEGCGFKVYKLSVDIADKMYILLDVEADKLSSVEKREGPPVENYVHSLRFVEKYNNYFVEKDRLYALRPRRFTDIKEAIRFFFKHSKLPSHMPEHWEFCDPPEEVFKKYEAGLI